MIIMLIYIIKIVKTIINLCKKYLAKNKMYIFFRLLFLFNFIYTIFSVLKI